jgi:hypothetical protein
MQSRGIKGIQALLQAPAPGFWCRGAGRRGELVRVEVQHELGPPATADELAALREIVADSFDSLKPFYSIWNGGRFFVEAGDSEYLLEVYSTERMPLEQDGISSWMEMAEENGWSREEVASFLEAVAIGQPPSSPDQLVVKPSGEHVGKVLQFDHETLTLEERGPSLEAILLRLAADPARLNYDLGCMCRYKGGMQAIPYFYAPDIRRFEEAPPIPDWFGG